MLKANSSLWLLASLLTMVVAQEKWRYATFYDYCTGPNHGRGVNIENNGCLRQQNRHSVSLGNGDKNVLFCRSWYEDGDCKCLKGGKMYRWWELEHDNCDSEDVEGHTSLHFEKIDDYDRGCPTSGCYGSNENPVKRTRFDKDGNRGEEYISYD